MQPARQTTEDVRVAVVSDHGVVAAGMTAWLEDGPGSGGTTVVAEATTVAQLLTARPEGPPVDVVLLDLLLADRSRPADNVAALVATGVGVLVFSLDGDLRRVTEAVRAGAAGHLPPGVGPAVVREAVTAVAAGGHVLDDELRRAVAELAGRRPDLSPRQQDVLVGYTSSATKLPTVARGLDMRPETLKTHLRRIKEKYAAVGRPAHTRLDLYRRAREDGYLDPSA
ncbi:response regulator transcription factor [Geodermatophilaceae bacterium NBWT11]|nr:response regulator transcription factor [Geodermatophilaceae bacterium NBWT11]